MEQAKEAIHAVVSQVFDVARRMNHSVVTSLSMTVR